jgi:hypothetical protein
VLDGARQAPLSEDDYEKLKEALHALAAMLVRPRNTEKTSAVLGNRKVRKLAPGLSQKATLPQRPDMDANALFYRTLNGAEVGDLFMSLIHTCQLCSCATPTPLTT